MALYSAQITDNGSVYICHVRRRRDATYWIGTILVYGTPGGGTFGSGTITWNLSPDNGVTLIPMKDLSGNTITSTAADNFNTTLGNPHNNDQNLTVYATMAGATNPNVTALLYDNL